MDNFYCSLGFTLNETQAKMHITLIARKIEATFLATEHNFFQSVLLTSLATLNLIR